jgi:hypothetical protein
LIGEIQKAYAEQTNRDEPGRSTVQRAIK